MDAAFNHALGLFEQAKELWDSGCSREAIRQCRAAVEALEKCGRLRSRHGVDILYALASWLDQAADPKGAIGAADHACAILHQLGPRFASPEAKSMRIRAWLLLGRLLREHTTEWNRAGRFLRQAADAALPTTVMV
jgi:hypothetical protein